MVVGIVLHEHMQRQIVIHARSGFCLLSYSYLLEQCAILLEEIAGAL